MTDIQIPLTHTQYKAMEDAIYRFSELETTHVDFLSYFKSWRLPLGDVTIVVNGPLVMRAEVVPEEQE